VNELFIENQRGVTGDWWVTFGQRPFVTRPAKLLVNMLLVNTSSFSLFPERILNKKF
jgi:hypothetical protein